MKIIYPSIVLTALLLSSCGNNEQRQANTATSSKVREEGSCYAWISGKDTILLKIGAIENIVTGELDYNFFEKDDNDGQIEGVLIGDTLVANYHFQSEGVISTREVAFLRKEGAYIEGFGEMEEKNGVMTFANRKALHFNPENTFTPIDCEQD